MSRILAGALVAATALAGTIYWEVQDPAVPDIAPAPGRSPVSGTVHAAPAPETNEVLQDWVATALARPVFREDRRPARTADAAGPKGDAPARLAGVITGRFGNRAIFMSGGNAKPIVAQEGQRVSDFVVRTIEPGQVVVEADGMVRTMKLTFSEAAKPSQP
jgi:hypothetical protein